MHLAGFRRYYLEVIGRRRISITNTWEQDGYRMATATLVTDAPADAAGDGSGGSAAELAAVLAEVDKIADTWVDSIKTFYSGRRLGRVLEILER